MIRYWGGSGREEIATEEGANPTPGRRPVLCWVLPPIKRWKCRKRKKRLDRGSNPGDPQFMKGALPQPVCGGIINSNRKSFILHGGAEGTGLARDRIVCEPHCGTLFEHGDTGRNDQRMVTVTGGLRQ